MVKSLSQKKTKGLYTVYTNFSNFFLVFFGFFFTFFLRWHRQIGSTRRSQADQASKQLEPVSPFQTTRGMADRKRSTGSRRVVPATYVHTCPRTVGSNRALISTKYACMAGHHLHPYSC